MKKYKTILPTGVITSHRQEGNVNVKSDVKQPFDEPIKQPFINSQLDELFKSFGEIYKQN